MSISYGADTFIKKPPVLGGFFIKVSVLLDLDILLLSYLSTFIR